MSHQAEALSKPVSGVGKTDRGLIHAKWKERWNRMIVGAILPVTIWWLGNCSGI